MLNIRTIIDFSSVDADTRNTDTCICRQLLLNRPLAYESSIDIVYQDITFCNVVCMMATNLVSCR